MAAEAYNEFETSIIHMIASMIANGLQDGKTAQQIAEAIYLAWPDISNGTTHNNPKIPERY